MNMHENRYRLIMKLIKEGDNDPCYNLKNYFKNQLVKKLENVQDQAIETFFGSVYCTGQENTLQKDKDYRSINGIIGK